MNTHLQHFAAAAWLAAGFAFVSSPALAAAPIRICTFPGSPSAALDQAVAKETFKTAGIAATVVEHGVADGDDDGVSLKELHRTLGHDCDVIAGFPRSPVADAAGSKMLFSRGYLSAGYVSIETPTQAGERAAHEVVAATYASPSQLIAVQEHNVSFDLENTPELTVEAVANGRAKRAIVWYPAVVAYEAAHAAHHFDVRKTNSPYSDWQLVFAFGTKAKALQRKIDVALGAMADDGRLTTLTRDWALPATMQAAQTKPAAFAYLDGPVGGARSGMLRDAAYSEQDAGAVVKMSGPTPGAGASAAPSFEQAQVLHGKRLYASNCAKCHGANMQGITGPALSGPAFAPAANAHLTIGGIYNYMASNMPADRPGKLKDSEYADIMAFLLNANGYAPGSTKMTVDTARNSTTPLNAGPQSTVHTAAQAK